MKPDTGLRVWCKQLADDAMNRAGKFQHDNEMQNWLEEVACCLAESAESIAAPVPAREWIPVGERLPNDGEFIVYLRRGRRNAFDFTEWTMTKYDGSGLSPFATHWMPLPPPPAADK